MSAVTIQLPARLEPFVASRLKAGFESLEDYFLTLAESDKLLEERSHDVLERMSTDERAGLSTVLQERNEGPFEALDPFDEGYWDGIKADGRKQGKAPTTPKARSHA